MKKLILTAAFALSACATSSKTSLPEGNKFLVTCYDADGTQTKTIYNAEDTYGQVQRDARKNLKNPVGCELEKLPK